MEGWIAVNRAILDHWIWKEKEPFSKGQAWIDLLLMANHKEFKTRRKGKVVRRKRGEVNTSSRYLADRWKWSRNKVERFLKLLESDEMIKMNGAADGTTITIVNYGKWQDKQATDEATKEPPTEPRQGHDRATNGANDNNDNNGNNGKQIIYKGLPPELVPVMKDFEEMRNRMKAPMTARAMTLLVNKLNDMAGDDTKRKIELLNASIEHGWKSVYDTRRDEKYANERPGETRPDGDYKKYNDAARRKLEQWDEEW